MTDIHEKLNEIAKLSEEDITRLFKEAPNRHVLHDMAEGYCYDREICHGLGIDYNRVNNTDYMRAYVLAVEIDRALKERK